jgi:hypothetical protein
MRHPRRAAEEANVGAEIARTSPALTALPAGDARVDRHAGARLQVADATAAAGDHTRDLVAEDKGLADREVADAAAMEVVQVAPADAADDDPDLDSVVVERLGGEFFDAQVMRPVRDDRFDSHQITALMPPST